MSPALLAALERLAKIGKYAPPAEIIAREADKIVLFTRWWVEK